MRALHDSFVLFPGAEPDDGRPPRLGQHAEPPLGAAVGAAPSALGGPPGAELSHLGISILNGFARQEASGSWGAEFLVMPMPGGPTRVFDYVALTEALPPPDAPTLLLDAFHIDNSPERGGFVYLEVRGPDRVGFLGSLLRIPRRARPSCAEMWVATRYGEACDRFLLTAPDGRSPGEETRYALELALDSYRQRGEALSA